VADGDIAEREHRDIVERLAEKEQLFPQPHDRSDGADRLALLSAIRSPLSRGDARRRSGHHRPGTFKSRLSKVGARASSARRCAMEGFVASDATIGRILQSLVARAPSSRGRSRNHPALF
jgi:hypothetical protein